MTARKTLCIVVSAVFTVSVVASTRSFATASRSAPAISKLVAGKRLYRKFCGQCHSFSPALAAGFGSNNGLGRDGGPSFNELRVPFAFSVSAVTEPSGGHEVVRTKITSKQLSNVATFIAKATSRNPIPALPTDG